MDHLKLNGTEVYVISLLDSPRRTKLLEAAKGIGLPGEHMTFIDAVDGRKLELWYMKEGGYMWHERSLRLMINDYGATKCDAANIACSASHVLAAGTALRKGLDRVLICEDDVHLAALTAWPMDLNELVEKAPAGWTALSLFRSSVQPEFPEFANWQEVCPHNWGSCAYLLNQQGMRELVRYHILDVINFDASFQKAVADSIVPHGTDHPFVVSVVNLPPDMMNAEGAIHGKQTDVLLHMRAASACLSRLLQSLPS